MKSPLTPEQWEQYRSDIAPRVERGEGTPADAAFLLAAFRRAHYSTEYRGEAPGVPPPVREAPARSIGGRCYRVR